MRRLGLGLGLALLAWLSLFTLLSRFSAPVEASPTLSSEMAVSRSQSPDPQAPPSLCFWRDGEPFCRPVVRAAGTASPTVWAMLDALLAGPSPQEQAQGIVTAIPAGTRLEGLARRGDVITLYLRLEAPDQLDFETVEATVEQIARTLDSLGYDHVRLLARPPDGAWRPLSAYLPPLPLPRKPLGDGAALGTASLGQPPAEGRRQASGGLSGKTVYVSAGHGWLWNGSAWRTQRPPYQQIIEDHNNAEVVNQFLLRYLWNAGADVWPVRERDMHAVAVVADDADAGFRTVGTWTTVSSGGYGGGYRTATAQATASLTATWTFTLPESGVYALYVWYRAGADRVPDARYAVHHAGGVTTVSVDQRVHGSTWRYVGTFPFRAGQPATVTLSNGSAQPGAVVVADAMRVGGGTFDDLTGIETSATYPPDKPWWEMGAYYYVQHQGLDPNDWPYFNDVVARPMYARWEHADTGEEAVYIAWHTNGYNGDNTLYRGTESYIHSFQPVTGSDRLQYWVHQELVRDIRLGWDPAWTDRGMKSKDLGELRELWDARGPAYSIPGVLLEIAYHDNEADANALKDPRFALLAARAVYQGIVKYFEEKEGVDLTLLPEPPTHLVARNSGVGQVTLSWRPPPTDTAGLLGDPATGYRLYVGSLADGDGSLVAWGDAIPVTTTSYTLTGLEADRLYFFKVTATNAGGESFPTPVLAVRTSPTGEAAYLLVQGFDRIDRFALLPEQDPVEGDNLRMFLGRMNGYDTIIAHAVALTRAFDSALNEAVADGDLSLGLYPVVDWILGEESTVDRTLDGAEQSALTAFLDGGGALFLSGSEVGWDLEASGNGQDFYRNYLRAGYVGDDAGTYAVLPTAGGIFAGMGGFRFDEPTAYDADFPDQLSALNGSTAALTYDGGNGGVAALQYADGCQRLVYFGFPFETIAGAATRATVMARVMDFLDACVSQAPQTAITSPVSGLATNRPPTFGGTALAVNGLQRVEVQVRYEGPARCDGGTLGTLDPPCAWDGSRWVTGTVWLTATGTAAWSYPLTMALPDGNYRLQARAWDSTGLSDTSPAQVAFVYDTISPTAVTLITPTGGITVSGEAVVFRWTEPVSDTGSPLRYRLEVDGQGVTTTATAYTMTLLPGDHRWRVQALDAAGNRAPWSSEASFVVGASSVYLPLVLRDYPDPSANAACQDLILNGGFETDEGWLINDTTYPATYTLALVHSGSRAMQIGVPAGGDDPAGTTYSSVDQTVPLPATCGSSAPCTITLHYWAYLTTQDDAGDLQYVIVVDLLGGEGNWSFVQTEVTDSGGWVERTVDLSAYAGKTIALRFGVKNDGDGRPTGMVVDDVSLEACGRE